jgi:hypothetical protein
VNLTLNEKPPGATHWSERTMAAWAGIAPSSVHKIWAAHGLKPHLTKTFKLSRDPNPGGVETGERVISGLSQNKFPL